MLSATFLNRRHSRNNEIASTRVEYLLGEIVVTAQPKLLAPRAPPPNLVSARFNGYRPSALFYVLCVTYARIFERLRPC